MDNLHTCSTCIHDGCCNDLPYCGGAYWRWREVECMDCGREFNPDDEGEFVDDRWLCESCAATAKAEEEGGEE